MPKPPIKYEAKIVHWVGEDIECSEPVITTSPDYKTFETARKWGEEKANTPSPWPGRDYEDHFEVVELLLVDPEYDDWEEQRRWIYWSGKLDEIVTQ